MRNYTIKVNGQTFEIAVKSFTSRAAQLEVNGKLYSVDVEQVAGASSVAAPVRSAAPARTAAAAPPAAAPTGPAAAGSVTAPIPGLILEIMVNVGDAIQPGQPVLKMEAMKMQNVINATVGGTVSKVLVRNGDTVNQGQELVLIG